MAEQINLDGYFNTVIGHGVKGKDAMASYNFAVNRFMSFAECDDLYSFDGICRKIIDTPAKDSVRAGFDFVDGQEVLEQNDDVHSLLEDLHVESILAQAISWDRLFGGCGIFLLVDDGGMDLTEPLDLSRVKSIIKLMLFDPQDISITSRYNDPLRLNYGKPEMMTLCNETGASFMVHESRMIIFNGLPISNRRRAERDGWGGKLLDNIEECIQRYDNAMSLSLMALSRLSQGVLKLDGLAELLMSEEGEKQVRRRLDMLNMGRHIMNTLAIGAGDDYDQKNITLNGITAIAEQFEMALSAISGIPATVLFGRSPAGMNATGAADFEGYYNMVANIQQTKIKPALLRLLEVITAAKDYRVQLPEVYTIEFRPLWNLSDKEKAEQDKTKNDAMVARANAAKTFVDMGALDVSEVRASLQEDGCYMLDDSLDSILGESAEGDVSHESGSEKEIKVSAGS